MNDTASPPTMFGPSAIAANQPAITSHDLAQALRKYGIEAVRVAMVELPARRCSAVWTVDERGAVTGRRTTLALDNAFSLANAMVTELLQAPAGVAVVHKRSPRRWVYAWRVDEEHGVLAQIHGIEGRFAGTDTETALVRTLGNLVLSTGEVEPTDDEADDSGPSWPQVERRAPLRPPVAALLALLLIAAAAVIAAWLAFQALPGLRDASAPLQAEVSRLQAMADKTLVRDVTRLLAGGDYGEVQELLASSAELGYFDGAVAANAQLQIVASAGNVARLPIGGPVPDFVLRSANPTELFAGTNRVGQLFVLPRAAELSRAAEARSTRAMGVATLLAFVALILATTLLVAVFWQRGRRRA